MHGPEALVPLELTHASQVLCWLVVVLLGDGRDKIFSETDCQNKRDEFPLQNLQSLKDMPGKAVVLQAWKDVKTPIKYNKYNIYVLFASLYLFDTHQRPYI